MTLRLARSALFATVALCVAPVVAGESEAPELNVKAKGICRAGMATRDYGPFPSDGTYADNPPAVVVTMKKPCKGMVSARFSAQVTGSLDPDYYVVGAIEAKCLGKAGHAGGCSKGETAYGQPDYFYIAFYPDAKSTYSIDTVFAAMKPGKWRFVVRLGAENDGTVQQSTLTVEAFEGG